MEVGRAPLRQDLRMIGRYLQMRMTRDPAKRVRRLYEMYPQSYLMPEHSTYINYGYWENGCDTLDAASEALAALLAEAGEFQPDDVILDVGFGYGDQDFLWLRDKKPRKIYGLNITPQHVRGARLRAAQEGVDDQLDFREGSATAIPFEDGTFDRVVALESAFHFYTRAQFFKEAFRVLRPGGVLVMADIVPLDGGTARSEIQAPPLTWVGLCFDQENWYGSDVYTAELGKAGFEQVGIRSIRDKVYDPWRRYVLGKLDDPGFRRRTGKLYRRALGRMWSNQEQLTHDMDLLDYVVAVARKPEVRP